MNDRNDKKPDEPTLRPSTRNLMFSIAQDVWPNETTRADFGIATQAHYEAVYYPVRHGEISAIQLDDALGSGEKLTALVNSASRNPHQGIQFSTMWDYTPRGPETPGKEKDTGIER
jgi:hypothetical protein